MLLLLITAKTFIVSNVSNFYTYFAARCGAEGNGFFGFPTWYKYLPKENVRPAIAERQPTCSAQLEKISDVWLIALAVVEIGLRIAVLVAIFFIMFAGLKYVNSRGNAEKTEAAKKTLTDALIGLVIAVSATAVVTFIGGRFAG